MWLKKRIYDKLWMTFYTEDLMIPKLIGDTRVDSTFDHSMQPWYETMILTPDSSIQQGSLVPSTPGSPMSSASSKSCSRPSSVTMSSPYHIAQVPHVVPNMPTMDSTVSSARPEPELNIGTRVINFFKIIQMDFKFKKKVKV